MTVIRSATEADRAFWVSCDAHIAEGEWRRKLAEDRCWIIEVGGKSVGVMRYNLFWDRIPFLTMICFAEAHRGRGYGRQAMAHWERAMGEMGHPCVMTSTQSDEEAQHFYRKLGYRDAGCLLLDIPPFTQPTELFLVKAL